MEDKYELHKLGWQVSRRRIGRIIKEQVLDQSTTVADHINLKYQL